MNKITLNNGLRLVTIPQKGTETVSIAVLVGVGSRYETKEVAGISHFLEHMVFKGTKKRPTFLDVASEIDRVGGVFNAYTSKEFTGFWAKVAKDYFNTALDIISDVTQNCTLKEDDIAREKGVIVEEINMYNDSPREYIHYLMEKAVFPSNTLGWDQAGTKESVRALTRQDFIKYMKQHYRAENVVVAVAGNFDEKDAIKKVEEAFHFPAQEKKQAFELVSKKQEKINFEIINKKTEQTHFALAARAFSNNHPDKYVGRLLGVILGGGFSSRLFSEIRERRGLAYYVRGYDQSYSDSGYLAFLAGVDKTKLDEAIKATISEIDKLKEKGLEPGELERAKKHFKGNLLIDMESSENLADFYATKLLVGDRVETLEEVLDSIEKVTEEDIQRVTKEIFQTQNLNLAVIGEIKDEEKIRNLIKL